jgi:hypothetical protein
MFATFFGLHVDSGQSYADRFASVMHWIWRMSTADWDALTFWGIDRDDVGQTVKAALLMLLPIAALPFAFSRVGPARGFRLTTLATVSFALVATFFGQRLGGHDLTPTLPLLYVTAGSAVALIAVQPRLGRLSRVFAGAALACGIVLFGLNAHTAAALTARLAQHSADGLFSSIFSDYPAAALAAGDKTPHIFWQWGSLFQFIYGTEGKIPEDRPDRRRNRAPSGFGFCRAARYRC